MRARGGAVRDLLILGTGVHAGEMAEIVERVNRQAPTWNLLGILGADAVRAGEELNGVPILGGPGRLADYPEALCVPINEWPQTARFLPERLVSLIDPSAFVSRTARIGPGCVL